MQSSVNSDLIFRSIGIKLLEVGKMSAGFRLSKKTAFSVMKCKLKKLSRNMTSPWRHKPSYDNQPVEVINSFATKIIR